MNDIHLGSNNSSAIDEPLKRYIVNSSFFSLDFPLENRMGKALMPQEHFLSRNDIALQQGGGLQSSSVTRSGYLWQEALAHLVSEDFPLTMRYGPSRTEIAHNAEQIQRNQALIKLLRSWREGDEHEQQKTWEYLKHALDEDRLSDRKLFP